MIQIAVLGYGTVGSGVVEVINTNHDSINKRAENEINIKYVLDLRDFPGDPVEKVLVHDYEVIANDPEVDIVVEVMGGVEPAYTFTKRALEAGKSVCTSNKELVARHGTELLAIAKEHGIAFHTDAVQAYGHIPLNVDEMHIDMLSASGHKLHAPKGIGFLYIRKGIRIGSFVHGGAQERSRRAGTHNTPGIVGLGTAASAAARDMEKNIEKETKLRDHLIERVLAEIPYSRLNGDRTKRLPGNANFCFRFIEGESLLILLDQHGICASSGSACTSGSLDPSHVLLAIGLPHEIAHGSLRLTLSEETTLEDIDFTVDQLKKIVARLRAMSPLYEDFVKHNK